MQITNKMETIAGEAHSRFLLIHTILLVFIVGAGCVATVGARFANWRNGSQIFILLCAYYIAGVLYLLFLQSETYQSAGPLRHVIDLPVHLFAAVDAVLAHFVGGTALHGLLK